MQNVVSLMQCEENSNCATRIVAREKKTRFVDNNCTEELCANANVTLCVHGKMCACHC